MSSLPFDTHAFIKDLIKAGVPEAQAEAHIQIITKVVKDEMVTKQYFELKIKELENALTIRMGGMLILGITVVATLVKLL